MAATTYLKIKIDMKKCYVAEFH